MTELTRLNFVGLLAALDAVASNDIRHRKARPYEDLPRNSDDAWADVLVRGGTIVQPGVPEPYRADVAFDVRTTDAVRAACAGAVAPAGSRIVEVGDGRFLGAGRVVDATGAVVVASFTGGVAGPAPWLDAAAAESLARAGVGRIEWRVAPADRADVEARAAALAGPGRPDVVVLPIDSPPTAVLPLGAAVPAPATPTMGGLVDALLGSSWRAEGGDTGARLMGAAGRLEPDAPASFLVVRPSAAGMGRDARVESVWIGGREMR